MRHTPVLCTVEYIYWKFWSCDKLYLKAQARTSAHTESHEAHCYPTQSCRIYGAKPPPRSSVPIETLRSPTCCRGPRVPTVPCSRLTRQFSLPVSLSLKSHLLVPNSPSQCLALIYILGQFIYFVIYFSTSLNRGDICYPTEIRKFNTSLSHYTGRIFIAYFNGLCCLVKPGPLCQLLNITSMHFLKLNPFLV